MRAMTVAALLTLSLILPALAPAQQDVAADIREAASQRAWIREYLRLYDELLSMQAAVGGITGEQADAQLAAAGRELHEQGFYDQDMDALVAQLRAAAGDFLASIEYEVANSTAWPSDLPAESYRSLSTRMLSYVRSELERALARGADPAAALRGATLVLAFTRGHAILPPELDFFAGVTDRAAGAMPGIELMPIEGGRPPSVAAPGPRINPTVPVVPTGGGAGGGAGRPGTPIRVILRGGTVEGSARLIGRGSTDLVGRTTRPRGDGQPDTEIELRLLAPGFVVEAIEVRHDASGEGGFVGRVADRLRRTWSTRAGTESPVVGVVSNRNLLNRANGRLDGITLVELSELDLFIQDDGQLEASATPATVTVIFRGGEQATFPILSGAAGPVLTGGGRTTPTGGGQAPPVIVSGIPPRTPGRPPTVTPPTGMPPITVPAGGGVTPGDANTTWGTNATSRRGQGGQLFSYACPRGGSAGSVWGTDVYTDDSSVCTAAVHAGLITFAGGGTVTIQIRPGQSGYAGSTRNGVQSATYPAWAGSFAFVGAGGAAPTTTTFAGSIQTGRASYAQGETITVTFAGFPGTNDWIALAPAGAAAESYGEWKWTDRRTSGTLTFTAPAPGSYELRVFLDWSNGGYNVRATRPFTVGAAAPTVRVGGFRAAQWIGMDRDVVSNGGSAAPDGSPDGQFVIQLRLDGVQQDRDMLIPLEVRSIALYSADAGGNPAGGHAWHTQNAGNWVLGVVHGGRQLNAGHVSTLGAFTGMQLAELFDLYAGNSGYFNPGQYFLIEVDAGGAQPLRQLVQIPASFVPPTGGQPPAGGGGVTPGATRTDWTTTATDHRAQIGQRFRYDCPPNGAAGRGPWGTDLYTDDSSVCTAAVHAGLITFASGGTVVIEMRANPGRYTGSARYGVQSADYGSWDHAFAFVGAGGAVPPPTTTFAGTIQTDRASYAAGETITVSFSGFPGTNDWIALAAAGAAAESYGEWHWTDQRTSGTMTFTAPAAGSYELRAFLDWSNGGYNVRATRPITVGGGVPQDIMVAYDAAWVGMDADAVSQGATAAPDGSADAHFSLFVDINMPYEIRYIAVYSSDDQGNPAGGQVWHTQNSGYWVLGVATQGTMLNAGHVASLGTHQGQRRFELFAGNSGYFNPGQNFVVEVDVGLSEPLRRVVVVSGGGAAAGGGAVAGGGAAAGGRNAALNRPTAQSSLSEWSHDNDAGGAVDGQKTGSYGFHTQNEPNPWWMVDLGGVIPLRQIRVFNRLDCCPERANTLQIYLSPDNTNWQLVYAHPGTPFGGSDGHPLVVDLRGHSGRYVMLRLAETTYLHLDEVEIDHDLP